MADPGPSLGSCVRILWISDIRLSEYIYTSWARDQKCPFGPKTRIVVSYAILTGSKSTQNLGETGTFEGSGAQCLWAEIQAVSILPRHSQKYLFDPKFCAYHTQSVAESCGFPLNHHLWAQRGSLGRKAQLGIPGSPERIARYSKSPQHCDPEHPARSLRTNQMAKLTFFLTIVSYEVRTRRRGLLPNEYIFSSGIFLASEKLMKQFFGVRAAFCGKIL